MGSELRGPVGRVYGVAFSADGRLVAAVGGDGQAVLWDTKSAKVVRILYTGIVTAAVAFSPDSQTVAIGVSGGGVALYDLRNGRKHLFICWPAEAFRTSTSARTESCSHR